MDRKLIRRRFQISGKSGPRAVWYKAFETGKPAHRNNDLRIRLLTADDGRPQQIKTLFSIIQLEI
ncbi:hypothetical protein OFB92_32580, partial [Escherichia coli]|nr:hypothetical protein [Escherichia coli]